MLSAAVKRHRLAGLGLAILVLGACSSKPALDVSDQEPVDLKSINERNSVSQVWRVDTGGDQDELIMKLRPEALGDDILAAGVNGAVLRIDKNGRIVWRVATGKALSAGPASDGRVVVVGSSDGDVLVLDATNGKQLVAANVEGEVLAKPLIVPNGEVVVRTVDGRVVSINGDGTLKWAYTEIKPKLTVRGMGDPVYYDGLVITGLENGKVVGLNARDGREVWSTTISSPSGGTDIERLVDIDSNIRLYDEDLFVVGYQGNLVSMDPRNGQVNWEKELSSLSGVDISTSQVFVADDASHLWGVSLQNGTANWQLKDFHQRALTGPAVYAGSVFVGDYEGYVHRVNAADGSVLDRIRVSSDPLTITPIKVGGLLIVQDQDGRVYAIRATAPAQ